MPERSYKTNRSILLGQDNNALVYLVAINLMVFALLSFIKIIYYLSEIPIELFYSQMQDWFILPASIENYLSKPWVLFTYLFTHASIWGLISSLLWLWSFGYILQDLTGNNKLIPIYLYGGIAGGIGYLLLMNIFPVWANHIQTVQPLIGAGAAVMAVAAATTTLAPNYRIFPLMNGGIPLWVLLIVYGLIDFATLGSANAGVAVSHLIAGGVGYLFIQQLRRGNDWAAWMNQFFHWLNDLFSPTKKEKAAPVKKKNTPQDTQEKIDALLDKINQEGYQFLTNEEKAFLKKASKEDLL